MMCLYKVNSLMAILGLLICFSCNYKKTYQSPGMMVVDGCAQKAYVSLSTGKSISIVDIVAKKTIGVIPLSQNPTGLAISKDGQSLYVCAGEEDGCVYVIDLTTKEVVATISVGHTPDKLVLSKDEKKLFVTNRFSNTIGIINLKERKVEKSIPAVREPRAMELSPDGETLFVANFLPDQKSTDSVVASKILAVDVASGEIRNTILLANGSHSVQGMACSLDGKYLYITHLLSRYNMPLTQLDRGWVNTNALTILDIVNNKVYETLLLDDVDNGAANPAGIYLNDRQELYIALSGTHELMILDMAGVHHKLETLRGDQGSLFTDRSDTDNSLNFINEFKKRVPLNGKSPRFVVGLDKEVFVSSYFSPFLDVYNIEKRKLAKIILGDEEILDSKRKGELAFCDASLCYQKWQSCVSCHPDARIDGLNWDQMNDGIGNPKNTKSMLFSLQTPPSMITGIRASAQVAIRKGFLHMLNNPIGEDLASDVDTYLEMLKPVVSPYIQLYKEKSKALGISGKDLFERANCSSCHSGKYYTDKKTHTIGMGMEKFDTPSLREIWRTAPYLYDGRARTIREVLTIYNKDNEHGITQNFTDEELELLELYILTL